MYKGQGGVFIKFSRERTVDAPFVVVEDGEGYVTNITDTGVVGFRYLTFDGSESKMTLKVKGNCKGSISVYLNDENINAAGNEVLMLNNEKEWAQISLRLQATAGDYPLRIVYSGEGMWELDEIRID